MVEEIAEDEVNSPYQQPGQQQNNVKNEASCWETRSSKTRQGVND